MTATVTVITPNGVNDTNYNLYQFLANIEAATLRTATSFTAVNSTDNVTFAFTGSGFRYNAAGDLIAGSITSYTLTYQGEAILTTEFLPRLSALRLWQAIDASEFGPIFGNLPHVITGGAGADTLRGQDVNDIIEGGAGADLLDGGDNNRGVDTLIYTGSVEGVTVSMLLVGPQESAGDANGDVILNFENLIGSLGNDRLTGDSEINVINGLAGNDTIDGHDGNDILIGGAGIDTLSYISVSDGVTVNLALTGAQQTFGGDIDRASGFENLTGSNFDDLLRGSTIANVIHGADGDDVIEGGRGADLLYGDANSPDGDTASYAHSALAVKVDLNSALQSLTNGTKANGDAAGDTLTGFENVLGSVRADTLIGDGLNNQLTGGLGKDTLTGGGGEDTFFFAKLTEKGDHVTDFVSTEDILEFSAVGFKGTAVGIVNFESGSAPLAAAKNATFLYDTDDGNLYFDADGTGAGAKQLVVTLDGAPALTALDLFIV